MMASWSPEALDELAAVTLPVAAELICQVRDGDQAAIEARLTPMDPLHMRALVVVLAAMVPDDRPLNDLIAWTRGEWRPLEPITPERAELNRAELADALGIQDTYTPTEKGRAA
jgi:hypothetical protein